jgi:8-oxo-dGTP diphosphatase
MPHHGDAHTYRYPRPAVTVDVAVVTPGPRPRVLLIQRRHEPYAGWWALPGGFVDEMEPLADAARRELREETGLEAGELEQLHTFGDPGRDPRGWTVSVVYLARLDAGRVTPRAGDDAAAAEWFALDALPPLAFDHACVLARVCARLADRAG